MLDISRLCNARAPRIIRHEHSRITFQLWNSSERSAAAQDSRNALLGSITTKASVGH